MTSRELLIAAHEAVGARREWEDAQAGLRAPDLHPTMRERARARVEARFHASNDRLALLVCKELGLDGFAHVLAVALQNAERAPNAPSSAWHHVNRLTRVRITETSGVVAPASSPAGLALARARERVRSSRAAYFAADACDMRAVGLARSAYFGALIEYFDLRELTDNERTSAAE